MKGRATAFVPMMEEAVSLLRSAPPRVWAVYASGVVPYYLLLLYFCVNVWESGLAARTVVPTALPVVVGFVWLKYWQTRFVSELYRVIHPHQPGGIRDKEWVIFRRQMMWQPLALFAVPLSFVSVFLYPVAGAFFQHLTVCEALEGADKTESVAVRARRLSGENLRELYAYTLAGKNVFFLLALLNWLTMLALLPQLLYSLTGVENEFARSWRAYGHIGFWMTVMVFTLVTVDPLNKAFFLLRVYHADSRRTGADLRDRLRAYSGKGVRMALVCLMLVAAVSGGVARGVEGAELHEAIEREAGRHKYLWRMPPHVVDAGETPRSGLQLWLRDSFEWIGRQFVDGLNWLIEQWWRIMPERERSGPDVGRLFEGVSRTAEGVLWLLAVVLAGAVLWMLVRYVRVRRASVGSAAPEAASAPVPDLTREEVFADELAEEEWLEMVRDLRARGEWRLALRALFLAYLARLSDRNLIRVTRYKSNRDYERELARRAHSEVGVMGCYRELRRGFEQVWYGDYPATEGMLEECLARVGAVEGRS